MEAQMESRGTPPGGLDRYARYYAGVIDSFDGMQGGEFKTISTRIIRGRLVPAEDNDPPGVHVVEGEMPLLAGEGCAVTFTVGRKLSFRCARPGAWTPTAAQVAEVEASFGRQMRDFDEYARHYSGVTEGGRLVIRGVILRGSANQSGVYVHSEAESPIVFDRGCSVKQLTYDPSSKKLTSKCNDDFSMFRNAR
jgi:hypothetical protein